MKPEDIYLAKYMMLLEWAASKTLLHTKDITEVIDKVFDEQMREDLELYCAKLYDEETVDEV